MSKIIKRIGILCGGAALLSLPCLAPRAGAFDSATHRRITETALTDMGFDADSIYLVNQGNISVDMFDEMNVPEAHFDSETFSKGSQRLRDKLTGVMDSLDGADREFALDTLGRGLHTAQDFFSHSNFIENNSVDTPIDLLNLADPAAELVCERETFKGRLTSGYFPDNMRPSEAKCVHAELNKDTASAGQRYNRAVEKAVIESRHYAQSLLEAIAANPSWNEARRAEIKKLLLNLQ